VCFPKSTAIKTNEQRNEKNSWSARSYIQSGTKRRTQGVRESQEKTHFELSKEAEPNMLQH
jgi:hypothetical protein